ncbi:sodium-dependent transporter [Alkalilimnicola ehrlichii]|uniref:sodium-dependent transporter n=1 Tax=Alkalilimnicola ehrlichii TaxID=351052 RepID=UPI00384C5B81
MSDRESPHGQWSTSLVFVLAAAGSAVGLGNIWKFPYIAGEYGGGAFVLVYLFCIVMIGIPIMVAEITLGRRGRQSPVNSLRTLAQDEGRSQAWTIIGWMGLLTGFLILSFYSVVGGWSLAYVLYAALGAFSEADASDTAALFEALQESPWTLLAWHTLFMAIVFAIVARGVRRGLERALDFLMPLLFLLLIILVGYGLVSGNMAAAVSFMFRPDVSMLTGEAILVAMGHAFFTLSLGMGAIMVYGAYLPKRSSIGKTTLSIAGIDTLVAMLAGLAIFSIVFSLDISPAEGPGLLFVALPTAFGNMPGGTFFGFVFFALVSVAAVTSGISILEPVVAYAVEKSGWTRPVVAALVSLVIWTIGIGALLSFNLWEGFAPLGFLADVPRLWFLEPLTGLNIFDLLSWTTGQLLLPLGGILIALFAGWKLSQPSLREELPMSEDLFTAWLVAVRVVAPIAVLIVLLNGLGILRFS